jgi:recombinational DNA repair protein (RecF pathway)
MSHRIHNTDAFIVGAEPASEASAYVRLWTREVGILGAWCQGVRQMRSKLRHHTTLLAHSHMSLVRGRELWRVTGADTRHRDQLRGISVQRVAHRLLAAVWRIIPREEKDTELFDRFRDALLYASEVSLSKEELEGLELSLMLALLDRAGYLAGDFDMHSRVVLGESESLLRVHAEKSRLVPVINEALHLSQL